MIKTCFLLASYILLLNWVDSLFCHFFAKIGAGTHGRSALGSRFQLVYLVL